MKVSSWSQVIFILSMQVRIKVKYAGQRETTRHKKGKRERTQTFNFLAGLLLGSLPGFVSTALRPM